MRYRLMASYLGASYQAAVGPSDRDVTLFAAPPPPEEHGFSPAPGGIWRKQVRLDDLDALWESRPIGSYHGEPCLVLDDLGDRLHIVYLGMEERRAAQLGYWEVDRGVFEVVVPRYDVTDLAEERHEFPIALLLSALPRALSAGDPGRGGPSAGGPGGPGTGQNGAGTVPAGTGRAIGAIGPGSAAGPGGTAAAAGGFGSAAAAGAGGFGTASAAGGFGAGPGPNGMATWNGPAGAPQRVRGQLPAGPAQLPAGDPAQFAPAMSQPPALASAQQPITGVYQAPTGNTQNGAGLPGAPSMPPGGPQVPGGPQGAGIAQGASLPRVPIGQLAIAAPGQGAQGTQGMAGGPGMTGTQGQPPAAQPTTGTAPLPDPSRQFPVRPQLPVAQLPAAQQPMAQPPTMQQSMGQQPMGQQPMGQQSAAQQPTGQQPTGQQPMAQQPAAQQFPFPAAPQGAGDPQATGAAQAGAPQPLSGQAPAPTAVAAWHGSPAASGNGTWYYQPAADPQQGGAVAGGYAVNGMTPNGYAQQDQGSAQAGSANLNGLGGMQQYAQPGSQAPVTGYQQVPALAPAVPGQQAQSFQQPQNTQPTQAVQPTQAQQWAQAVQPPQPAQAQPGPQLVAPQAPQPTAPANGAEPMMPGSAAAGTSMPADGLPSAQAPAPPVGASAAMSAPASAPSTAAASPSTAPQPMAPQPVAAPSLGPQSVGLQPTAPPLPAPAPAPAPAPPEASATGPLPSLPSAVQPDHAAHSSLTGAGALGKLSGAVRGRRAARKPRLAMSSIFADLVDMADIPRAAYAVDEEITGAMCLFKTDGGYEVFSCAEDARHEVRFFEEEEAAYFYLFGVLAAEALRNGRLTPRRG